MTSYVWLNSEIVPESSASFFLQRSGLECGAGVFTTLRLANGHLEHLPLHIKRLVRHAAELGLEPLAICEECFYALVEANKAQNGIFRVKALYIASELGPSSWGKTALLIYLEPYENPAKDFLHVDAVCFEPSELVARIKTLSRLERRMLYMQAKARGFDEYITFSREGYLLEGIYSNIFWEHQGTVYTPDPALLLMQGIILQTFFTALPGFGYSVQYVKQRLDDIPPDAHLFLCNSLTHCLPILSCAKRVFKRNSEFEESLSLIKQSWRL